MFTHMGYIIHLFLKKIIFLYMAVLPICTYVPHAFGDDRGQKVSDLLELELQMVYGKSCKCWSPDLSPLQGQQVLVTAEPPLLFLQAHFFNIIKL